MNAISLPEFVCGRPAAEVDASLRQALGVCDRARECAVLWFAEVQRRGLYRGLGFASLEIYAVEGLGFSTNRYWQFKRLADDLDRLPVLRAAVAGGALGWTKAQQVARVATPETERAWVAAASGSSRRAFAQAVRQLRRRKSDAVGQAGVVGQAGGANGSGDAVGGLFAAAESGAARAGTDTATSGATDPASTSFGAAGVGMALAAAPAPATISLRGDALQVARFEALLEKAHKLGLVPSGSDRFDAVLAGLEALVAGAAGPASHGPANQIVIHQCPDCQAATVVTRRGELPLAPAQVEAAACDARVRVDDGPNRATIPPKTRAAVLARDRHRCATPGCSSTRFLEVHHVVPRAQGGSNQLKNLVTLCSRCHRFAHEHVTSALAPAQVVTGGTYEAGGGTAGGQPTAGERG